MKTMAHWLLRLAQRLDPGVCKQPAIGLRRMRHIRDYYDTHNGITGELLEPAQTITIHTATAADLARAAEWMERQKDAPPNYLRWM